MHVRPLFIAPYVHVYLIVKHPELYLIGSKQTQSGTSSHELTLACALHDAAPR